MMGVGLTAGAGASTVRDDVLVARNPATGEPIGRGAGDSAGGDRRSRRARPGGAGRLVAISVGPDVDG